MAHAHAKAHAYKDEMKKKIKMEINEVKRNWSCDDEVWSEGKGKPRKS